MKTKTMLCPEIGIEVPEDLIIDFASDPESAYEKALKKLDDAAWPLHAQLRQFVEGLPAEAVEAARADKAFTMIYGTDARCARAWFAQWFLMQKASEARLRSICNGANGPVMPYVAECLRDVGVDSECMVKLANFEAVGGALARGGFHFTICPTTMAPNSTFWLLRSFYEQGIADHVSVRLDPFLCGRSETFVPMMFKMIVYGEALNWDGIAQLEKQHHGRMMTAEPSDRSEVAEFCWDPRDDGVHFTCEALPASERIGFEGARYLHAIYDPGTEAITHLDGALRIYTAPQLEERLAAGHLRKAGKAGVRRKIFRTDEPVDRNAFSLIAQAFFVWNDDLKTYFTETLPVNP
jgi:hypothetical protein